MVRIICLLISVIPNRSIVPFKNWPCFIKNAHFLLLKNAPFFNFLGFFRRLSTNARKNCQKFVISSLIDSFLWYCRQTLFQIPHRGKTGPENGRTSFGMFVLCIQVSFKSLLVDYTKNIGQLNWISHDLSFCSFFVR